MQNDIEYNDLPHLGRRAGIACAALLLVSAALAGSMVVQRSQKKQHHPQGSDLRFRLPVVFEEITVDQADGEHIFLYRAATSFGDALLAVHQIPAETSGTPYDLCTRVLQEYGGGVLSRVDIVTGATQRKSAKLGPLRAEELRGLGGTTVVRAAISRSGKGYIFSLHVKTGTINSKWYGLFERACASVELVSD